MRKRKMAASAVSPDVATGFESLHDPQTRDRGLIEIGQWVIDTCLVFGCRLELACQIASLFVGGLRRDLDAPELKAEGEKL